MPLARQALFLDRDGVINRSIVRHGKPYAPVSLDEFEVLPGVADALLETRAAGFLNVIVTNQPDIATGKQDAATLERMHGLLIDELAIDSIRVCTHIDADGCDCRKPKIGMLLQASRELDIDLSASFMVGDRWSDVVAGQRAGCTTFFIDYGYAEKQPDQPFIAARSLSEATGFVLQHAQRKTAQDSTSSQLRRKL